MKSVYLRPDRRWFLNATAAIVVLPVFVLFVVQLLLPRHLDWSLLTGMAMWQKVVVVAFGILMPSAAALLILWKGAIRLSLVLMFLSCIGIEFDRPPGDALTAANPARSIELSFGMYGKTGIDVYCNGEHLGKTPFTISDKEFGKKVKPWTTPPRQDRFEPWQPKDWYFAKYTWMPTDLIEIYSHWPPLHHHDLMHDEQKALKYIAACPYWWRFESNGHRGLCRMANFGGGGGGTGGHFAVSVSPDIEFPSLEPHLTLVIEGLLAEKDGPSAAWIDHFRKHQNLLFLPFFEKAKSDPRLSKAIDAVVRAEYGIPAKPSADDCDRILGAILDHAEAAEVFQTPSPESIAIDMMSDAAKQSVVRRFREESSFSSGGSGRSTNGHVVILQRSGKGARRLPLEYAVKRLQPPELFDGLVYRWARTDRDLDILAAYTRNDAVRWLVEKYVIDAHFHSRRGSYQVERALQAAQEINNWTLEDRLRQFVQDNAVGMSREHYATTFIKSRIGAPGVDQNRLAMWIAHAAPLQDEQRLEYLLRIHASSSASSSQVFTAAQNPQKMMEIEHRLAEKPNPGFDQFLVNHYWEERDERRWGNDYSTRTAALLRTDTPATREFIKKMYETPGTRDKFLDRLRSQKKADLARLAWLTPSVEQFTEPGARIKTVRLLASFRTPEADKLLDRWAREGNDEIRKLLAQQQAERTHEDAVRAKHLQQWADLLAGKIQPNDLIPREKPWSWNGERYVQEK